MTRFRPRVTRRDVAVVGYVLVIAGVAGLAGTVFRDWNVSGGWDSVGARLRDRLVWLAFVVGAGPVWSLATLAAARRSGWTRWRVAPIVAAAVGAAAAVAAAVDLHGLNVRRGVSVLGPIAVLAAALLVIGWLLVAVGRWHATETHTTEAVASTGWLARTGRGTLAGLAVLAVLAAAAVPVVRWYTEDRFIDHRTASGAPAGRPTGAPGQPLWRRTVPAPSWIAVSADAVLVQQRDGVRGLDPTTGEERWRYLRRDLSTLAAVHSTATATVLVLFNVAGTDSGLLVSLDESTADRHRSPVNRSRRSRSVTPSRSSAR
jgi:hypothetical protein